MRVPMVLSFNLQTKYGKLQFTFLNTITLKSKSIRKLNLYQRFLSTKRANPIRLVMNLGAPSASRRVSYKHDSMGLWSCVRQSTWLLQRAFMRCTVVACHTVERPEGVCTSRSVRNLARALGGASGDIPQYLADKLSYLLTSRLILSLFWVWQIMSA